MFLCPASVSRVLFRRTLGMGAGLVVWDRHSQTAPRKTVGTVAVRNMREGYGWSRGTGSIMIL